ncbi:hypothetical protein C0993_006032 [Termitomyces sp. T159_Od127]|nr:hypothetical protein C0993_006032 [Termitomyces sp. T159_Od127]
MGREQELPVTEEMEREGPQTRCKRAVRAEQDRVIDSEPEGTPKWVTPWRRESPEAREELTGVGRETWIGGAELRGVQEGEKGVVGIGVAWRRRDGVNGRAGMEEEQDEVGFRVLRGEGTVIVADGKVGLEGRERDGSRFELRSRPGCVTGVGSGPSERAESGHPLQWGDVDDPAQVEDRPEVPRAENE